MCPRVVKHPAFAALIILLDRDDSIHSVDPGTSGLGGCRRCDPRRWWWVASVLATPDWWKPRCVKWIAALAANQARWVRTTRQIITNVIIAEARPGIFAAIR